MKGLKFMFGMVLFGFILTLVMKPVYAQEGFLGEIRMFAGQYAPRGWAFCDGQMLSISQHSPLFAILGTSYGGDGRMTFALPDLRGRAPIHAGAGPGLTHRPLGLRGGSENTSLTVNNLPPHSHLLKAQSKTGNQNSPRGNVLAGGRSEYSNAEPNTSLNGMAIGSVGGGQPHNNMQPFLIVNYIICLEGLFPSRN